MKLLCNVNQEGRITESIGGVDEIIPDRQYDYEFEVSTNVLTAIHLYRVIDGKLVRSEENA